jgi:ATP phosphoribosyltransferase
MRSSRLKKINVALPKGRLGKRVYKMFEEAGYECPELLEDNRKLIFENEEKGIRFFWVKPSDVTIYVERGAADIGIAGKDILLEYRPDVFEVLDMQMGKCRMAVAARKGFRYNPERTLRVATKFPNIARAFYSQKNRDIDIINLHGSIELAPIVGLSDVIVDIVETGKTLYENNLEVIDTVVPISARLIVNKAGFRFKTQEIEAIRDALAAAVEGGNL